MVPFGGLFSIFAFEIIVKFENFNLKIGEGPVHKDFDDQLVGMQPGDNKEFNIAFPDDYKDPNEPDNQNNDEDDNEDDNEEEEEQEQQEEQEEQDNQLVVCDFAILYYMYIHYLNK